MPRLLTILSLALLLAAVAPGAPVPPGADRPQLFHPHRVGDRSVYLNREGKEGTFTVTRVEDRDGAKFVTVRREASADVESYESVVRVGADGVYQVETSGNTVTPPKCLLKLPHKDGGSWSGRSVTANAVGREDWSATAVGWEWVEVPVGRVRAIKVEGETRWTGLGGVGPHKYTSWYFPGLGQVKWVAGKQEGVLKSFTPAKD